MSYYCRNSVFRITWRSRVVAAWAGTYLILALGGTASAADYRIEVLEEAPPKEGLSPQVASCLETRGLKVIRGSSRTYCKIWFCKGVSVGKKGEGYSLADGSLVGVIQYARKGSDFRDQEIPKGVYTMRFASIPTDGAHEGVSPTPSFLLLTSAEEDQDPAPQDVETLVEKSSQSIDSSHPAILALKPTKDGQSPQMWHDEEHDWWLLQTTVHTAGNPKPLKLALVMVGYAEE